MRAAISCGLLILTFACNDAAADPPGGNGRTAYLSGLDALESAKYADAAKAFSDAIEADEEKIDYWIARAVAKTLTEDLSAAEKDLKRALRFDQNNKEAKLWLSAVTNMKGDFMNSSLIYPQATRDQYENAILDMSRQYGELAFREQRPDEAEYLDRPRKLRAVAIAKFGEIAASFANRAKGSTGDLAPLLLDRAKQLMAKKDWAGALKNLQKAAETNPNDMMLLHWRAICNLNLGAPAAAREQFTRVLTANPTWAPSFAGRAAADIAMGDIRRGEIDVDHACRLDPAHAADFKQVIELARNNPAPKIKQEELPGLVKALHDAARGGAKDDDLFKQAMTIVKGAHAHRLRADETYFTRRLDLEAAAKSGAPDALADFGEFLYREAVSRHYEKVEPRAPMLPYRLQDTPAELAYSERSCDAALAKKPDNIKALTYKASCLMERLLWGDAETLLKKALAINADYGPLLESFARLLNHAAGVRSMKAAGLRSTETWSDANYIYWRYPTQAELDEADALDRQANELWNLAHEHLDRAVKKYAGKPEGFYYTGVVARQNGQTQPAIAAFEQCVKLDPKYEAAWDNLAELYSMGGLLKEAAEAKSAAVNLTHTTAGHMLHFAWGLIAKTKYRSAREALDKAIAYDAADPRCTAFLGVIAAADDKPDEALAWYRSSAAIEEARAFLNGLSLRSAGGESVAASAVASIVALNDRLGRIALEQKRPEVAADAFKRNIALETRVPRGQWFEPIAASMLPDQDTGEEIPPAHTAIALFMWAHLGLGQALQASGKPDDAVAQYQTVLNMPKLRHATIDPGSTMGEPWMRAKIEWVKMLMARNDIDGAWMAATSGEAPNGIPRPLNDEMRQLTSKIQEQQGRKRNDDYTRQLEEAQRQRQAEIDRIRKEQQDYDRKRRPPRPAPPRRP